MRVLLLFCALCSLLAQAPARRRMNQATANQDKLQQEVVGLVNEVRTRPARFAEQYLRARVSESPDAAECYRELEHMAPVPALQIAPALMASAADHAEDTGRAGITGHTGRDGSNLRQRIERHGDWDGSIAEDISYGRNDPLLIVLDLLIDEGIPDRGHRRNLLDPSLAFVGAAFRPHQSALRFLCVLDFARRIK